MVVWSLKALPGLSMGMNGLDDGSSILPISIFIYQQCFLSMRCLYVNSSFDIDETDIKTGNLWLKVYNMFRVQKTEMFRN